MVETIVRQLSAEDYDRLPDERKTGLSNYYIREMEHGRGRLFGSVDDEGSVFSYAILTQNGRICSVSYVETWEPLRGKGYASGLLSAVMNADDVDDADVYFLHISSSYPAFEAVMRLAQKTGFSVSGQSTIYTAEMGDDVWKTVDMMDRKKKYMLKPGDECLPFSELSAEQIRMLEDSRINEFKNQLDPVPFLSNEARKLSRDMSFAYFRDGELLAYSLATLPRFDSVVIEQISTAQRLIGRGTVIVPLTETMQAIHRNSDIRQMNMTIYDNNYRSRRFVHHLLEGVRVTQVKNYSFRYRRI